MPQYTSCVNPNQYKDPGEIFAIIFGLNSTGPLKQLCDYMLNGKLVCLGGDKCAIGRVAGFETVANKKFLEKIDNDFSINLLLAPYTLNNFDRSDNRMVNYRKIKNDLNPNPQRELIIEQPNMPLPYEPAGLSRYYPDPQNFQHYNFRDEPVVHPDPSANAKPIMVPVLHCEIEGNRLFLVCGIGSRIENIIPQGLCKVEIFGIPLGKAICKVVKLILTPVILPSLALAWAAGSDDNRDYQGAGSLNRGDLVVITGRWVYDASHSGQNELHAVKTIHKLNDFEIYDPVKFPQLWKSWCTLTLEIPPIIPPITDPGVHPVDMTPAQQTVYDNQRKPENRWYLHPLIDGCEPPAPLPPPLH